MNGVVQTTAYPGWNGTMATTNDTATFSAATAPCSMNQAHTLASLTLSAYTGVLELNSNLTLSNAGGSCGSMNSGEILQPLNNGVQASITIGQGTFTFAGGQLNYDATTSPPLGQLTIQGSAEMDITVPQGTNNAAIGDNLTVSISGTLKLANSGTVTLYSQPTIRNSGGTVNVTVDGGHLALPAGANPVTIQNMGGTFKKTAGIGTYTIDDPINNASTLEVDSGTLEFVNGDPTTQYSVNESAGFTNITVGTTLQADNGVGLTGNQAWIQTLGTGTASLKMNSGKQLNVSPGQLFVGSSGTVLDTANLHIVNGDFEFQSGALHLVYNTDTASPAQIQCDGTITINGAGTTLSESFLGTGQIPSSYICMTAVTAINGTCQTNPLGWNASIVGGNQYQLTKAQGMGMAPSAQSTTSVARAEASPSPAAQTLLIDPSAVVPPATPVSALGNVGRACEELFDQTTGLGPSTWPSDSLQGDAASGIIAPAPTTIHEATRLEVLLAALTDGTVPDPAVVDALFVSLV